MLNLSKSKYCLVWQCPKLAWLNKYKPELQEIDDAAQARFESGNQVGDLTMDLFGDYVEVTTYKEDGNLDLPKMIEKTAEEMQKGTDNICEASFSYNGLFCSVDILKKKDDGYAIYEVKSSSTTFKKLEIKPVYIADISYQKYVLEHCGINVTGTYLVTLNKDYVRQGELDKKALFNVIDVEEEVFAEMVNVEPNLAIAETILGDEKEPEIDLSVNCNKPYECGFKKYCMRHLPQPSVFDLYKITTKKAVELYKKGVVSFDALSKCEDITNKIQLRQIDHYLNEQGAYINVKGIREFLGTLSYPLYFLDFETMQQTIPEYDGTHPYQQIPFQYSLHYIETEGGELKHKELLVQPGKDPRREVAESLCRDIPMNVCVMAYNKTFECTVLTKLAAQYPDLKTHLLNIRAHMVDLCDPFQGGHYYNKAMTNSFSIKSVLPALFPDDPSLDYHNLEGIHNGGEAMTIYPKLHEMPEDEQQKIMHSLLKYCELDTYAMVKVWELLVEKSK